MQFIHAEHEYSIQTSRMRSDLSRHRANMSEGTFSHVAVHSFIK